MSNCIEDCIDDYDLVKKCRVCKNILLKSNFHKNKNMSDGFNPQCKLCTKKYIDNQDRLLNKQKLYEKQNRDKINAREKIYLNNRYKTDIIFRLICKTRSRIRQALKGKIKSSSTIDILGIDINTYKRWIEFQTTPEMNWSNIEIDHVKPICLFNISDDEELKLAFNWKNTQPLLKEVHSQKGVKYNFLDYQLQFIKAYLFLKLNEEERLN